MEKSAAVWRVAVTVPAWAAEPFSQLLADRLGTVSVFGEEESPSRQVEAFDPVEPDAAGLSVALAILARSLATDEPQLTIEQIPPTDWLAATFEAFPPIRVGRFHIHGSHEHSSVPPGAIGLCLDAATAFGTGEHETTSGCLESLLRLAKRRRFLKVLDMGCGSGILALAAARLWKAPVLAVDVDPEAVRVARVNARVNRVRRWVTARVGDGYAAGHVAAGGPYDLIVSNILARPLVGMARHLAANLAPGGVAVLAGLLTRQQAQVMSAHRANGLELVARLPVGDWQTLVLRKRRGRRPG